MGITAREQQILDLADAGLNHMQIARRMGIQSKTVRGLLSALSGSPAGDLAREAAIRAGTQRLGAAVMAAGGHR